MFTAFVSSETVRRLKKFSMLLLIVLTSQLFYVQAAKCCGTNEEFKECGTACEPSCNNTNPICILIAVANVCRCVKGYIRQYANGPCIPARECPPDTCDTKQCPPGTVCQQDVVSCKKPPCPASPPKSFYGNIEQNSGPFNAAQRIRNAYMTSGPKPSPEPKNNYYQTCLRE
ncbi:trypsin Inhibitor like cysteine rich domain protein [Necator americanus]|uniref:Trypsin Inhibitor like cysteine rich domain protein n=1 Tax=Necator americanus TaxID=51031 RepID=W2SZ73_NECAM|nr:trypsin Inhibitor like cysteine rich domain protein [Necator americanus]ETN74903.1 trypsin Inhibitor like cysteine rich domain protein [Necator americanus]